MDRFTIFTKHLIANEGFKSDHPADAGGKTIWGVASKKHPQVFQKIQELLAIDKQQALNYTLQWYWHTFYNPLYDHLPTPLAFKLFDFSVNAGKVRAVLIFQRTIVELQLSQGKWDLLVKDGIFGQKTLEAALELDSESLLRTYINNIIEHYKGLIKRKPSNKVFYKGWVNRAVRTIDDEGRSYNVVPPSLYR